MLRLLSGPVLVGFAELFDKAYGDPKTPRPYPFVTPSRIGSVLLPFACPACHAPIELASVRKYSDTRRGFSWCPRCKQRYVLDKKGSPLKEPVAPNALTAPASVKKHNQITKLEAVVVSSPDEGALNLLGAICE